MIHVLLPDDRVRPLHFYLAMEEYLASLGDEDYLFMWQVEPTVIIGRNQNLYTEVNLDYCREHNINVVRRRSGGGCVYADMKNVMFSYITTSDTVTTTFSQYTSMVAGMLVKLGIEAHAGGRNDILIGDRKVSGNAFYHRRGRAILHGTMLFDTDIEEMLRAITPSTQKLSARGVESVRSRVVNLSELTDLSLEMFKKQAAILLCDREIVLNRADVSHIDELALPYIDSQWLEGRHTQAQVRKEEHIDGVGEFRIAIRLNKNLIDHIYITGDFFLLSDLDDELINRLKDVDYSVGAIAEALAEIDVSTIIASLSTKKFIELLTS